ncbi:MAG: MarR family winged helix-turn-helix transcriptional regulator [Deltaproteobacteria bacterium]|nr:MarR family winged helix-turn-helix transcriptional regulator [Deltaproteobacteria bacterium]
MANQSPPKPGSTPSLPCLCAAVRKAGRRLTRHYDRRLEPSGLKITQFSMLANINRNPGLTVSDLAGLLVMDQTTVTRNLGVLVREGYVRLEPAETDRRVKRVYISGPGAAKLAQARPWWDQAQREVEETLGRQGAEGLLAILGKLAE